MESEHSQVSVTSPAHVKPHWAGLEVRYHVRELLEAAGVFIVVFVALHLSIQNFRIDGTSMYPTFVNEQHIIVSKLPDLRINLRALGRLVPFGKKSEEVPSLLSSTGLVHGEVIAFTYPKDPSREFVKRVIGLPGDTVELEKGQVIRNGEVLDEPYVVNNDRRSMKSVTVPEGSYYVLGDNRPVSNDSRSWGFVSNEHIIGRVWYSYWPTDRIEFFHGPW